VNILRRLPIARLLLLCGLAAAVGVSATALAFALGTGPKPPAKSLPQAIHDALGAPPVEGVSASVTLTNHLLEGANLATGSEQGSGGGIASSPLLTGASGRLWIAKDGRARLELQAEKGDTQVIYDGHTISIYDAASNTLYRYTPKAHEDATTPDSGGAAAKHEVPSVAKIEEAIAHIAKHADVSGASPSDVAGAPTYTVHISPKESGSLIGGAELSFDADNGAPLRAAIYSSTSSSPVIELAATEVSFGPVADSVFQFTPPADAKIEELSLPSHTHAKHTSEDSASNPKLTPHGSGITTIGVLESKIPAGSKAGATSESTSGLPKVSINGASASELRTELGTLLTFERSGVRYLLAGAVGSSSIEALARGL
jgi:outer membrane lipoprotein-sorting protein